MKNIAHPIRTLSGAVLALLFVLGLAVNTRAQSIARIVFFGSETSKSGLFAMYPDGSGLTQLSQDSNAAYPAWSPGQAYIAYADMPLFRSPTIYIMDAIGTLHGGHAFRVAQGLSPDWSPDGTQLVFVGTDYNVYIVSVDPAAGTAGTPALFVAKQRGALTPNWSPDGTRIAFSGNTTSGARAIFTRNVNTGVEVQLPQPSFAVLVQVPNWSADSSQIAFVAVGSRGSSFICLVNADGSNLRVLPSYPNSRAETRPTWSPDDSAIALQVTLPIGTKTYQNSICLQDLATGAFTVLTPSALLADSPDWAP